VGDGERKTPAGEPWRAIQWKVGDEFIEDLDKCSTSFDCRDKEEALRGCANTVSVMTFLRIIHGLDGYERVRVKLVGHADETMPDDTESGDRAGFQANFEYAEARIINARHNLESWTDEYVTGERQARNLEWVYIPVSTEPWFLADVPRVAKKHPEALHSKLRVEVEAKAVPKHLSELEMHFFDLTSTQPLPLMDYVYFMVYTTTTTGYGDIVPVGQVPRLITVVGNLFEVVFLVVFLGAVVSGASQRGTGPGRGTGG
jgi:hypothetical protein